MATLLGEKLTPRIRELINGIDLQSLSRIDETRLASKAMQHMGSIELVASDAFAEVYDTHYIKSFPKRAERENSNLIVERLAQQDAGLRPHHAPYRLIGIRDSLGAPIGAAHISVLPLPGGQFAVPYLQYIYVRPESRRQDMSEVLHTMVLAVATADAARDGRTVPFTFFETETRGHGDDDASRNFSHSRTEIHQKSGGVALMLMKNGEELSPHVQPGLEEADPPVTLLWAIRPSPAPALSYDIQALAPDLLAAYYQSLRDEGFPEKNIRLAEDMVAERCGGGVFCLVPLSQVGTYKDPRKPEGSTAATAFAEL